MTPQSNETPCMIFSEESSRAILRDGQHGVDRTETNLGDYSVSFLPEARTRGSEHVSMRRMASTQSKYDGPNQSSFCSVESSFLTYRSNSVKREKERTQPVPGKIIKKAMDARRGATKRHEYTSTLDRWQNDEIYRASQLVHGWTEEWVKYLDYISKIDISHEAPYRQRLRYESTLYEQAGPLCQRQAKVYLTFRCA